ncbi:glycosyltransferase [Colwellia sp. E150_009]
MNNVLHIVTDYPDDVNSVYTKAVKNLLDVTEKGLNHQVISIVRKSGFKFEIHRPTNSLIVLIIPKVKLAIANIIVMRIAYTKLCNVVGSEYFDKINIVHAHKLTIDGLLGWIVAKFNKKKLVISIRGSTDVKWVNGDILGRPIYKKIFNFSNHKFWVSAWAKKIIINKLSIQGYHFSESLLPNICHVNFNSNKTINITNKFIFIGRLDSGDTKGLLKVIQAVSSISEASLDIFGSFSSSQLHYLESYISGLGTSNRISLLGRIDNEILKDKLSGYCALLVPSNPETFGISYIEALAQNIPILGSKNAGVSGYFNNKSYVRLVEESHQQQILSCVEYFLANQQQIKNELHKEIHEGKLDFLSDKSIKIKYISVLERVVKSDI